MAITKVKGTYDLLPDEVMKWKIIEDKIKMICHLFNYLEIRTPLMEYSELFHRSVGETSDLIRKETYDFKDRGDRNVTLRPEGTAGVVRAFIENKMFNNDINKLFYFGNMFRYERPQKGRYRQFAQFGVETIGSGDAITDAECISLAVTIIKAFGLKGIKVHLNSLGDEQSRINYKTALIKHFSQFTDGLCLDCKNRLENNPLRILDCKVDKDKESFLLAPKITDFLTNEAKKRFDEVQNYLNTLNIEYTINPNLVRGLDYYTSTIFEIEASIADFGAQNIMCGGGRYDNLVNNLGGVNTPSFGFAFGMERLLAAIEAETQPIKVHQKLHLFIICLGDKAKNQGLKLLYECRFGGLVSDIDYLNKSLKAQFKIADKYDADFIAIIGEEEVMNGMVNIKINKNNIQHTINQTELYDFIVEKINEQNSCNHDHCGNGCSCGGEGEHE